MGNLSSVIQGSATGATVVLEKNYVKASDAPGSLWVASGAGITVAVETSAINLPEGSSKTSAIKIQRASGTDYVRYRFVLDRADTAKKLKVAWNQIYAGTAGDYTVTMFSYTDSAYSIGATSLAMSLTSIPNITGSFAATFDAPAFVSAPYIELRINGISSTTALYLSGVVVGPGSLAQSAVISEWVSYSPALPAPFGTTTLPKFYYQRVGSNMEVMGSFKTGTIPNNAVVYLPLPTGTTIDTSKYQATFFTIVGDLTRDLLANPGPDVDMKVVVDSTQATNLYITKHTNTQPLQSVVGGQSFDSNQNVSFVAKVAIAEWTGSGTVTLSSGAIVEYAYNTDATATADPSSNGGVASSTAGSAGIAFSSNWAVGTQYTRRVRFQYPIQSDDLIDVEIQLNGVWLTADKLLYAVTRQTAVTYGIRTTSVAGSTTDIDILFTEGGYASTVSYGANGASWASLNAAYKWRVRKAKASTPVGIDVSSLGGGFTLSVQNTSFTAVKAFQYLVDTSSVPITATLPVGTITSAIKFSDDTKTWSAKNLTITPATGERIQGLAINESLICDVSGAAIQLSFDGTRWVIDANTVAGSISISNAPTTTEKNYVLRPDATTATDWVSSNTSLVLATTESNAANLPENATKTTAIKITRVSGTTGYVYYRTVMDNADLGKKLKLQWNQKYAGTAGDYTIQIFGFTASDYSTGSTQLTLQTSSVSASNSTFLTSFDSVTTLPYLEIRIVAAAGTTPLYLSGVLVGPGVVTQSAAVSGSVAFTMTIAGATSNPTKATTPTYDQAYWVRNGEYMDIHYSYYASSAAGAAAGSGDYRLTMPTGYTIDSSKLRIGTLDTLDSAHIGEFHLDDGVALGYQFGSVYPVSTTLMEMRYTASRVGSASSPINVAGWGLHAKIRVPIAEWSGSGTLNLGPGAQVEYASNNGSGGTAAGAAYTSGSVAGPAGSQFVAVDSVTLSNYTSYKVSFQYPIQQDDLLVLEQTLNGGVTWLLDGDLYQTGRFVQNTAIYSSWIQQLDSTSVYVNFGNAGRQASSTYGTAGAAWSGIAGNANQRWRVRKAKASSPVGFGLAGTDGSAGLYQAGRAPGHVTGAAISAGMIGELIESAGSATSLTSNQYSDGGNAGLPLTPGCWMIQAVAQFSPQNTTVVAAYIVAIGTVSGNSSTGQVQTKNTTQADFSGQNTVGARLVNDTLHSPNWIVNISANTTYYPKAWSIFTTSTLTANCALRAVRIA